MLRGHLEPEPVESRFPFVGILEIVDVIGGAVDVAAEPQLVGLLPRIVGLGFDCGAIGVGKCQIPPLDADGKRSGIGDPVPDECQAGLAVTRWAIGQVEVRIARVDLLGETGLCPRRPARP